MKQITALAMLAVTNSFAFDQYLPVARGKFESDAIVDYSSITGEYDSNGKKQSLPSGWSESVIGPALQFKYGVIDDLDVSLGLSYPFVSSKIEILGVSQSKNANGLGRPDLAVKYVPKDLGIGGFVDVVLPMGSKKIVGDKPATTIIPGVLFGKTFDKIVVNALAGYVFNTEVDKIKQDRLDVYAQGQYNVAPLVGPYLGLDFTKAFQEKDDGKSVAGSDGYLLTLEPGANLTIDDKMAIELNVPFTVLGKNAASSWGVAANFRYTLGL